MKTFKILEKDNLTKDDLIYLMEVEEPKELEAIFNKAYEVKKREIGQRVFYRGLIEFGNYCVKNCYYCGIRKDNIGVERCLKKRL